MVWKIVASMNKARLIEPAPAIAILSVLVERREGRWKFFDKFKRKTKPNTVENGDFTKPEAPSQSVQNDKIEPGIPLNLNTATSNNLRKGRLAGVGILAVGVIVSGLIGMTGGDEEAEDSQPKIASAPEVTGSKNLAQDKAEIALMDQQAASDPVPDEGASEPQPEVASQVQTGAVQPTVQPVEQVPYDSTVQATPSETTPFSNPKDRKMSGNVLVKFDSSISDLGSTSSESSAQLNTGSPPSFFGVRMEVVLHREVEAVLVRD